MPSEVDPSALVRELRVDGSYGHSSEMRLRNDAADLIEQQGARIAELERDLDAATKRVAELEDELKPEWKCVACGYPWPAGGGNPMGEWDHCTICNGTEWEEVTDD